MAQSYVGKRRISKGIGGVIRTFKGFAFRAPIAAANVRVSRWTAATAAIPQRTKSLHNSAGAVRKPPSCARRGCNELLIFLQSALILVAGAPGRSAMMMRNQTTNFRNSAAQFFLGSIALLLRPPSPVGRSKPTDGDLRLSTTVGAVRRFSLRCPPTGGYRRDTTQRPPAVSSL